MNKKPGQHPRNHQRWVCMQQRNSKWEGTVFSVKADAVFKLAADPYKGHIRPFRTTKLTPNEDADWIAFFNFAREQGMSVVQSDIEAWRRLQLVYERLQAFDGAKA